MSYKLFCRLKMALDRFALNLFDFDSAMFNTFAILSFLLYALTRTRCETLIASLY